MGVAESLAWVSPELAVTAAILVVIAADLVLTRPNVRNTGMTPGVIALGGGVAAVVLALRLEGSARWLFGKMLVHDQFAVFFKVLLGLALVAAVLMSLTSREVRGRANEGEYYTLLLSSALGRLLMAGAGNLLMAYLALEFVSLTSYVLTGFLPHDRRSGEAALKYLIYGGVASGAMIYGMSWIFGLTGSMSYSGIAQGIAGLGPESRSALYLAFVLVLAGFGYKIAVVPFHMWAPDVYTGAPLPVTAFLAVGSKAAGFAILLRFFYFGVLPRGAMAIAAIPLVPLGSVICLVTMTLGNLAALSQTNMKRLLAYSSISHAGYAFLGFVAFAQNGVQAVLVYLVVYYVMNLGAFWVVLLILNETGREDMEAYRGLAWRGGAVPAVALTVFLASLAGLPPMAGFIGKLYVFAAGIESKLYLLVLAGALNSVISLYYYWRIVRTMFLDMPLLHDAPVRVSAGGAGVLAVLSVVTVVLGLWFGPLVDQAASAAAIFPG